MTTEPTEGRQRYYLTKSGQPEREVTRDEYVDAELLAFTGTPGEDRTPPSPTFSSYHGPTGTAGRMEVTTP